MIAKKLIILTIVLSSTTLSIHYFNSINKNYVDKVYPNIYVDNWSIGGKTKKDLQPIVDKKNQSLYGIKIFVTYNGQTVATFSGQMINLHTNIKEIIEQAYLIGRSPSAIKNYYQIISSYFGLSKFFFLSRIDYTKSPLIDFINLSEDKYNKPARNALFKFEKGKVLSFRQEENGLKILSEEFFMDLANKLRGNQLTSDTMTIILKDQIIKPDVTLAQANQYGIKEEIGMGKSDYSHSIPERVHNITLASSKFDGVLILKGKEFSFNDTVGDISSLTGYKPAYIIKNGKTVLGDGGGVCQVSTTIFRAVLNAGLTITERNAHAYRVSYYENDSKPGFDATVFDPTADLKFLNDTQAAILIQTEIDQNNHILNFRLYGEKDGRQSTISSISLYDQIPPPPPIYQDDPTLKRGVVKQIDFAAWGAKASFNYKVVRDGQTIFQKTFYSNYRPWQAVYSVGTAD